MTLEAQEGVKSSVLLTSDFHLIASFRSPVDSTELRDSWPWRSWQAGWGITFHWAPVSSKTTS